MTSATSSEKRLQLVPNWNGMTMPETTPMPNDTAKILIQKVEMRRIDLAPGDKMQALQDRDEGGETDGEGGQQEMPGDDPGELDPGQYDGIHTHRAPLFVRSLCPEC